ncbi:MAG: hypothetical protein HYV90_05960 [Candidatus Woesebacteria bacterium]|nr:MAG: hypothetical protein HYV90_05960 [Candidatus Woesebacteria bacterium]
MNFSPQSIDFCDPLYPIIFFGILFFAFMFRLIRGQIKATDKKIELQKKYEAEQDPTLKAALKVELDKARRDW